MLKRIFINTYQSLKEPICSAALVSAVAYLGRKYERISPYVPEGSIKNTVISIALVSGSLKSIHCLSKRAIPNLSSKIRFTNKTAFITALAGSFGVAHLLTLKKVLPARDRISITALAALIQIAFSWKEIMPNKADHSDLKEKTNSGTQLVGQASNPKSEGEGLQTVQQFSSLQITTEQKKEIRFTTALYSAEFYQNYLLKFHEGKLTATQPNPQNSEIPFKEINKLFLEHFKSAHVLSSASRNNLLKNARIFEKLKIDSISRFNRLFLTSLNKSIQKAEKQSIGCPNTEAVEFALQVFQAGMQKISEYRDIEGLFRVSGQKHEMDEIKKNLVKDNLVDAFSKEKNLHNVTGIMKSTISELNPKLIPDILKPYIADVAEDISEIKHIIQECLPLSNQKLLETLILYLHQISTEEEFKLAKMNAYNLAIVWAPILFTFATIEESLKWIAILQAMIENTPELFS